MRVLELVLICVSLGPTVTTPYRTVRSFVTMKSALNMESNGVYSHIQLCSWFIIVAYGDSKTLSLFPFIAHGYPDNNLESLCISDNQIC
jgi:hypothetical protein